MAGGIDWFRWHHGSVSDPKFGLVAKRAGATVAEVIAVWASLLELASAAEDRGCVGNPDFEAIDFGLGMGEGTAERIYQRMTERELIDRCSGRINAWEKRQPKREDETAAERKRRQREREHELQVSGASCPAVSRDVTQGHDRGEERREEVIEPSALVPDPADRRRPPCPSGDLLALYHRHLPMLPRVEVFSDGRKRALAARWGQVIADPEIARSPDPRAAAIDWFDWYFGYCAKSQFLTGSNNRNWRADFDFLLTASKFAKAVEGHYHKDTV